MKRKLVRIGTSLAVTLPAGVVQDFKLKKGQSVDVSVHPMTGAVTIRPGIRYFENGKVTRRFREKAEEILRRREALYRELGKY
jgi:antitoxin component of MazEF toxin-antitoxin module